MTSAAPGATGIKAIVRKHIIQDMIRGISSTNSVTQRILVVDRTALRIVNSAVTMNELLDENVIVVEPLEKRRQPYHSMDAIYFLTPNADGITRIIEDFTRHRYNKDGYTYANAHLFFTGALDDRLLYRLKSSPAIRYIRTLKEFYMDFVAVESQCFSLERPHSLVAFYGSEVASDLVSREFNAVAAQLASFCITLGEFPFIRYAVSNGMDRVTSRLAALVYDELERYAKEDPDFPAENTSQRATLLILDRTGDTVTPLLHEFSYQAMANDLLNITDGGSRYKYKVVSGDGGTKDKEVILDEALDPVWASIRHMHIAECINYVISNFNKFISENKAASGLLKGKADASRGVNSLQELKDTLSAVPQFQELKGKFSVHINMSQECMALFEKYKLAEIASVEQDLATGETSNGDVPKNIEVNMIPLLDDPKVLVEDKVRLLMLYIIAKDGVRDEDRRQLLEHARISSEFTNAITNLALLGIKLTATQKQKNRSKNREKKKKRRDDDVPYDLSRYSPSMKTIIQELSDGRLAKETYPFVRDPSTPGSYGNASGAKKTPSQGNLLAPSSSAAPAAPVTSLRSTKPSWHNRKGGSDVTAAVVETKTVMEERRKAGRLIVFVAGGMTFSEMRVAYEMCSTVKKDVIVGSTHMMTPKMFLEDLKRLRQPLVMPEGPKMQLVASSEMSSGMPSTEKKSKGLARLFSFGKK